MAAIVVLSHTPTPHFPLRKLKLGRSTFLAMAAHTLSLRLTNAFPADPLKISLSAKEIDVLEWKGDFLTVGVTEKDMVKDSSMRFQNSILKRLDLNLGGLLSVASSEEDFTGKSGQATVLRLPGLGYKRIGLIGLGSLVLRPPIGVSVRPLRRLPRLLRQAVLQLLLLLVIHFRKS